MAGVALEEVPPMVPVGLCAVGDPWHAVLSGYKASPVAEGRRHFAMRLSEVLDSFFSGHRRCLGLIGGGFDAVCVVPSSTPGARPGWHPLADVLAVTARWPANDKDSRGLALPVVHLGFRSGVPAGRALTHLHPEPSALEVLDGEVTGLRILVVDDMWTTGAHALSAVAALLAAGAAVGCVLVAGRCVARSTGSPSPYRPSPSPYRPNGAGHRAGVPRSPGYLSVRVDVGRRSCCVCAPGREASGAPGPARR